MPRLSEGNSIRRRRLSEGGVYQKAAFIRRRRLSEDGTYQKAACIRRRRLSGGGVYQKTALVRRRRLSECGVYQKTVLIGERHSSDYVGFLLDHSMNGQVKKDGSQSDRYAEKTRSIMTNVCIFMDAFNK